MVAIRSQPPSKFPSKVVLITGCSSGIGRATAIHLRDRGWLVYATARRLDALEGLKDHGCHVLALDVTDDASMRQALDTIQREHGTVGVLVNNAGYCQSGALEELDPAKLRRQFETNVFGLMRLSQLALPGMRAQHWGRIINISSIAGRLTFPGAGAYHASKHALVALSDALRFEVRRFGIDVVLVEPGFIRTEFSATAVDSVEESSSIEGPYSTFTREVRRLTSDVYTRPPYTWIGADADAVALAVSRAMDARRPRSRYAVAASGRLFPWLRRLLPDSLWDKLMRAWYPQPGE